jgi:hypothetical protein
MGTSILVDPLLLGLLALVNSIVSIHLRVQNLAMSSFSNVDLVWKPRFKYGLGQNKMAIKIAYIPHAKVLKF